MTPDELMLKTIDLAFEAGRGNTNAFAETFGRVDAAPQKVARYVMQLYIDRPIEPEGDPNAYIDHAAKTDLEREVLRTLRKLDGDCDCEVMTAEIVDEGAAR